MTTTPHPAGTGRTFTAAVFIATSLDGYIARPNGDIQWLISRGRHAGDTGYEQFIAAIDCVAMGRSTYEQAITYDPMLGDVPGRGVARRRC